MKNFKFKLIDVELQKRAPILRSVLQTIGLRSSQYENDLFQLPAVCTAAAVLLKNRCSHMNAMQLLINSILQHSSLTVSTEIVQTCDT